MLEDGLRLPDDAGGAGDEAEAEGGGGRLEALHAEVAVVHVEGERLELHRAQERHLGVPEKWIQFSWVYYRFHKD